MKENNNVISIVAITGLVIALIVLAFQFNTTQDEEKTISVSGTSEMEVVADEAYTYIEIMTKGESASEAENKNAMISNKIKEEMLTFVSSENIETQSFFVDVSREWNEDSRKYEEIGFEARHILKITTQNIDDVGAIIDSALDNGATGVQNIQFGLQKDTEQRIKQESLDKAIGAARLKAASMASSADIKLGEIVSINENSFNYHPMSENVKSYAEAGNGASLDVSPQTLSITTSVSLQYQIK